jgi:hypothetical protein
MTHVHLEQCKNLLQIGATMVIWQTRLTNMWTVRKALQPPCSRLCVTSLVLRRCRGTEGSSGKRDSIEHPANTCSNCPGSIRCWVDMLTAAKREASASTAHFAPRPMHPFINWINPSRRHGHAPDLHSTAQSISLESITRSVLTRTERFGSCTYLHHRHSIIDLLTVELIRSYPGS